MRVRSASAHAKVLKAATELIAERGMDATSMDAVAEASGVSKATIYKHWVDKEALLLEVMDEVNGLKSRPKFGSGNVRSDIIAVLAYHPEENAELRSRITPHFMAYAAKHVAFADLWRNRVMEPPRQELRRLLNEGMEKGELEPLDVEMALTQLVGPMLYWYVFLRRTLENPRVLAEVVVETFWRAHGRKRRQRAIS